MRTSTLFAAAATALAWTGPAAAAGDGPPPHLICKEKTGSVVESRDYDLSAWKKGSDSYTIEGDDGQFHVLKTINRYTLHITIQAGPSKAPIAQLRIISLGECEVVDTSKPKI